MKKYDTIFLDRDGIINVDYGYVYKIKDFEFTQDILSSKTSEIDTSLPDDGTITEQQGIVQ